MADFHSSLSLSGPSRTGADVALAIVHVLARRDGRARPRRAAKRLRDGGANPLLLGMLSQEAQHRPFGSEPNPVASLKGDLLNHWTVVDQRAALAFVAKHEA